jgi:hypothetical protein
MDAKVLSKQIATTLNEPNSGLVRRVIQVIGAERAQECLQKALEIETNGGMLTKDGSRRRTPGGVFFQVVREAATSKERRRIFPRMQAASPQSEGAAPAGGKAAAPPKPALQPPTWEEAKQLIVQAYKSIAEGKTVKLTLIGRPSQVTDQGACVVMAIKGKPPGSLPAGLPTPPAQSAITWAVFVATKQWKKVQSSLDAHAEDELIIEGYPMVDPKRGVGVVLATNCQSKLMQRAEREAKQK